MKASIEEILSDFKLGKMIILMDDEARLLTLLICLNLEGVRSSLDVPIDLVDVLVENHQLQPNIYCKLCACICKS